MASLEIGIVSAFVVGNWVAVEGPTVESVGGAASVAIAVVEFVDKLVVTALVVAALSSLVLVLVCASSSLYSEKEAVVLSLMCAAATSFSLSRTVSSASSALETESTAARAACSAAT
eukprot:4333204-Pleurochrysis_carterae.AAC.1